MRLVPLNGTAVPTGPCDDVHFGAVELFREGAWGRICAGRFGGDPEEFTLDAQVVCRQLGFRFGTLMNSEEVSGAYDYTSSDYSDPPFTVWATEVWAVAPCHTADTLPGRHCCPEALLTCLLHSRSGVSLACAYVPFRCTLCPSCMAALLAPCDRRAY